MINEILRALREFITSEQVLHGGRELLMHVIQQKLPEYWQWAKDNWSEIWEAVSEWF